MHLIEMLERGRHLSQHDVCAGAIHLADVIAFKRVHEALGHAIGLRTAHRGVDGFDAQLLDQGMRILRPKSAAIIAQEFQLDAAAHLALLAAASESAMLENRRHMDAGRMQRRGRRWNASGGLARPIIGLHGNNRSSSCSWPRRPTTWKLLNRWWR